MVIEDNTLKVRDQGDFLVETSKKNEQKVKAKRRKTENVSTILVECDLNSKESTGHVELTVPNEL